MLQDVADEPPKPPALLALDPLSANRPAEAPMLLSAAATEEGCNPKLCPVGTKAMDEGVVAGISVSCADGFLTSSPLETAVPGSAAEDIRGGHRELKDRAG